MTDDPIATDVPTVVCCIEAGRLEEQTLRMVRTLRRWGGRLASAPVLAVAARRAATLAPGTAPELRSLGVELARAFAHNPIPWFNFANKVAALSFAERHATTPTALWLDSDILVAGEPAGCFLPGGEALAGRGEFLAPATREPGDRFEPYWRAICEVLGVDFDSLPYLDMAPRRPIRLYLNAGVLAWRRGTGFVPSWRDDFLRLMRSRLSTPDGAFFFNEQACLGLTARRLGLPIRHLERRDHHMIFQGQLAGPDASPPMSDARIIHYSKSCGRPHWPAFLDRLRVERPEVHDWLAPLGPVGDRLSPLRAALRLPYKVARSARLRVALRGAIPRPRSPS